MDFFKDILPMIFSLIAIVLVLYLSYVASKHLAKRVNKMSGSNSIRIAEKAVLGQDKGLAIIEVCSSFYLISFSNNKIEILKELPEYNPETNGPVQGNFYETLMDTIKSRVGPKAGDSDGKK